MTQQWPCCLVLFPRATTKSFLYVVAGRGLTAIALQRVCFHDRPSEPLLQLWVFPAPFRALRDLGLSMAHCLLQCADFILRMSSNIFLRAWNLCQLMLNFYVSLILVCSLPFYSFKKIVASHLDFLRNFLWTCSLSQKILRYIWIFMKQIKLDVPVYDDSSVVECLSSMREVLSSIPTTTTNRQSPAAR